MKIRLAYGKKGLDLTLAENLNVTVIEPRFVPGLVDSAAALVTALRQPTGSLPLRDRVRASDKVGIVFSDITRPSPSHLIVPAVLAEISHVPTENVTLFEALGTHRPNSESELRGILGNALVDHYRIIQNDAFDPSTQVCLGTSSRGHEIWLNRELVDCDFRILTGFIEPHFFAGFSGGGKSIMPGMAGQPTILGNHDAGMIADPRATWGVTNGNPIWHEITEVARKVTPSFLVNVTLNKHKEVTGVFAGDLESAHAAGCAFSKQCAMASVSHPYDIVITTNSGHPLDLNLYQAVKGMSAAAQIVREGGSIVVAADCWDGIPEHGLYGELLRQAHSPQQLLTSINAPGFLKQDQWQAQLQAQVQLKADVYVRSDNLTDAQIESAMLRPVASIEATIYALLERYGHDARICVIPEGPQTIPYISQSADYTSG